MEESWSASRRSCNLKLTFTLADVSCYVKVDVHFFFQVEVGVQFLGSRSRMFCLGQVHDVPSSRACKSTSSV